MKYVIAVLCAFYVATASADKCTDVYASCVNSTGSDPMSRLRCGMKYLECRFNEMRSDEDLFDEIFDEEKNSCKEEFKQCRDDAKSIKEKVACYKEAAKCKYEEKVKPKMECLKKCQDADSLKARMECRKACFKPSEAESDVLFDGEEKDCKEEFKQCRDNAQSVKEKVACYKEAAKCNYNKHVQPKIDCLKKCKDADSFKARMECRKACLKPSEAELDVLFDGEEKDCKEEFKQCRDNAQSVKEKVACYKEAAKCNYNKHVQPKVDCLKKCQDADSFKARMECRKACFKPSEAEPDVLFDGEEKDCKEEFKQCRDDAKSIKEKVACYQQAAKCSYEKHVQPKVDCLNKCKSADSLKARMECRMKCFKDSEAEMDFADVLFDGEEKSCVEQLKQCMGDAKNMAERGACIDASKQCAKDKLQPKIDCVNKCREGYRACAAAGTNRWTCGKQFYQCVMQCKDA